MKTPYQLCQTPPKQCLEKKKQEGIKRKDCFLDIRDARQSWHGKIR